MSIRDLFEKPVSIENVATSSVKVESNEYILESINKDKTFQPYIDFSSASNFAKFGSAYEYYTNSLERIYGEYPYDGSRKEKIQFEISSSYLDRYILDTLYPKSTGYINFSYGGWGSGTPDNQGYGAPAAATDREYIFIRGGLHTASSGMETLPLWKTFENSIVYSAPQSRTKTFVLDPVKGWTVEFWLKKDAFDTAKSSREVILDLWNNNSSAGETYGRFTVSLNGDPSANGLNSIQMLIRSGSRGSGKGIFETTVCSTSFHTSSLATWGHYALSVVSESSGLISRFYVNGDLNKKTTHDVGGVMNEIGGRINGQIGSLISATSHASPSSQYSGKLSASLDDFRVWKTRRTSEQIYDNWYIHAAGGTNTDDANIDLGIYYKFNEGIVGYNDIDSNVLDYSGRMINGTWTGYTAGSRNTGSAFLSSSLVSYEEEDPIINSKHPNVVNLLSELQASGSDWDEVNPSLLYNTIPQWIRDEDEEANSNVKYLYQIMSSYFDTLYTQITALPALQNKTFPSASYKALPFAKNLLESKGMLAPNIFVESDILELFGKRDNNQVIFDEQVNEIKNLIYTNIYNNLDFIYKSKGTEKSIRNMLRCFGIDDEVVKLNVYTDGGTHYFNDNYKETSLTTKYINFNKASMIGATMFLTSSDVNSNSFVTGSDSSLSEKYSAFTAEIDVMVPHKLKMHEKGHFNTPFLSSSVFGMHQPADSAIATDYAWPTVLQDVANFQVYLLRDSIESDNAKFVLTNRDGSIFLTSSLYGEIYDNQRWNLAVRVKPDKYPLIGNIVSSSNPTYNIELYGVTHDYDDVRSEFTVTSSISYASGSAFLSKPKRFYLGAHRENFSGSLKEGSDLKIGSFRYYLDYLDDSIIKEHNLDPSNYGLRKSYQNPTLFANDMNKEIPSFDILAINYDFSTITGSNVNGQFIVEDLSSGSADSIYDWADQVIRREHRALGYGFPASVKTMIDNEPIFSLKKELPEISYTANNIFIKGEKEENLIKDDDLSDNFFALEKSMGQTISEEMLKMFSSVKEMNNLVGKATDRYRLEYKRLNVLRRLFFERNEGNPDLDRFTQYFKWIDKSVGSMVNQLFPISVRHAKGVSNIVESHILERNKYQNKMPLLERYSATETSIKGQAELKYNWKYGHAPLPNSENDNCLWNKDRKTRTDITERETINKIILNHNNATAISASTDEGVIYEASTYAIRSLAKPYSVSMTMGNQIHGGTNYPPNKDRDFITTAVERHGDLGFRGVPKNVLLVGEGTGSGEQEQKECHDIYDPNYKKKLNVKVVVGKHAGGGLSPIPVSDSEVYTYRNDMSKLPLTIVSGNVSTGFNAAVSSSYSNTAIFTNLHSDTTDFTNIVPIQGPFTEAWVGGHQSRHVDINRYDSSLRDDDVGSAPPNKLHNQYTRPEAWRLLLRERYSADFTADGAFGFAGFDYGGPYPDPARKPAIFYRGLRAKRPLNIENIKTTTGSIKHGNYKENYEIFTAGGRLENNFYLKRNPDQANYMPSYILSSSMKTATHPMSLVAYTASAQGNVFGTHTNSRQPDQVYVEGSRAVSTGFYSYGVSGSVDYKYTSNYPKDPHGIFLQDPFDIKIEIETDGDASYGDVELNPASYANSVAYWNFLSSSLNANGRLNATYQVINSDSNYSMGIDCLNSGSAHAALSSSTFVEASSSAAYTFSTWVNMSTSSAGGNQKWIFNVRDMTSTESSVQIYLNNGGDLWVYRKTISSIHNSRVSLEDFEDNYSGSWVHLAVTDQGNSNEWGNIKIYVNGVSQSVDSESRSGDAGRTALTISGSSFVMCRGDAGTNFSPFNGKFDETTYWKTALSASNIKHLYNAGVALNFTSSVYGNYDGAATLPDTANLVSWWSFDNLGADPLESYVDTVTDVMGNNHLGVRDKYFDSMAGRHRSFHPVHAIRTRKPMAFFSLTASTNGAQYNITPTSDGFGDGFGYATSSVEGTSGLYYYPDASSSFSGSSYRSAKPFSGGVNDVAASRNLYSVNDGLIGGEKNRTIISSRFSAPGGIEVQTKGYLDAYSHEYSVHNAIPFRNLTVRGSGSGENGTIRSSDLHGNRFGLRTHLQRHSGKFGADSVVGSVTTGSYVTVPSFHKIPRNISRKATPNMEITNPSFNYDHDNLFLQRPIPQSDYQYSWVTASLGSNYGVESGTQKQFGYMPRSGEIVNTLTEEYASFTTSSFIDMGLESTWDGIIGPSGDGGSNGAWSAAFWFRWDGPKTGGSDTPVVLSFGSGSATGVGGFARLQIWDKSSKFQVELGSDVAPAAIIEADYQIPVGTWMHVGVTVSITHGPKALFYINGEYVPNALRLSAGGTVQALSVGRNCTINTQTAGTAPRNTNGISGDMSKMIIYNSVRSDAQMIELYSKSSRVEDYRPAEISAAVLYYRLGAGSFGDADASTTSDTNDNFYNVVGSVLDSTSTSGITIKSETTYTTEDAMVFPSSSEIFGV